MREVLRLRYKYSDRDYKVRLSSMRHSYFEISNFKGIGHIRLDFEAHPRSNVYTLVGLNESGKTTILEALNFLSYKIETLDPLDLPGYSTKSVYDLIPINKRSNFNEKIIIKVVYVLNSDDKTKIKKFCEDEFAFQLTQPIDSLIITQSYSFKDSELISGQPSNVWSINLIGKSKRGRKEKQLEPENKQKAFQYIKKMLPSILYFPNFLFEFPDKIYLEDPSTDSKKHEFYRTILQDVLDAIGEKTNVETHILNRAKDGTLHSRRALESVLLKMGSHISNTVFSNWNRIFKRSSGKKEIVVDYEKDDEGLLFLQLRIKDGSELYTISERSLGFRWFFAFLLLTQYRGFRKEAPNNVLFLLDEPASNLHSSAQAQLLKSFGNFPESCSIIYTTHSHHLINPGWLEGTFVVKNEGLDYDDEDNYKAKDTVITLNKYRDFVAKHPDQTTYFQPILDVLDYNPSQLENIPNVVIVEGKNDFYTLKYFKEKILYGDYEFNLMPGGGAGSLDDVIRLYIAWGRAFIVLLDADKEGLAQKNRYKELFGRLIDDRVFSLEDIDSNWKKKGTEFVIEEEDRLKIQNITYPGLNKFNKSNFNRSLQELYLTNQQVSLSETTKFRFTKILDFCKDKLVLQS